jgi:adenosylcobinamide-GDP ribazoletransferase
MSKVEPRRDLLREAWLAAAACNRWLPSPYGDAPAFAEEHGRALVFLPLVGLIIGIALALCDHALAVALAPFARSIFVIGLGIVLTSGLGPIGAARTVEALITPTSADGRTANIIGWVTAVALTAAEILALGAMTSPPARARALVLAMLLSRWAIVPIGYGLRPREEAGLGVPYFGGLRFAEFGISSVIALGLAMGLYDVVGLAAIIAVALAILGLRLLLSRRLGGVGGSGLAAGAAVCELVTIAVLAALSTI